MAFQKAADELAGSPTALQLRYLQTLVKISAHDNHTIVVPFPMEYIKKKIRKWKKFLICIPIENQKKTTP